MSTSSALPATGYEQREIVDAHIHVGDFRDFGVRLDKAGLETLMRHYGIVGGMVFSPDNQYTRTVVEEVDGAFGLVWANPHRPGFLEEAFELLDHPRFVGVKLHPLLDAFHPDDPALHPLIEEIVRRDMPVLLHCGHPIFSLPWSIEELAVRFPAAKVILGHMGHGNIVYINASIDVAARNPNVYLETSGMPMHTKIAEAVQRVGPEKVMYGSDTPFHEIGVEVRKVLVSGLEPALVERVLATNARKLFFGDEQADAPPAAR
jgi:predicted TIM-barrel fold metal-dependent hydrolase